jgi:transmembrane sensor
MSNKSISPELLDKYLSNQCTSEEQRTVEAWYAVQKGEKDFLGSLSELDRHLLEEETLKKIKTAISPPFDLEEAAPKQLSFWRNRLIPIGIAACFLLICWGGWHYFQYPTGHETANEPFALIEPVAEETIVRFVNKEAKLVTHRLPDGTQVCLHPNAELAYPKAFEGKTRQVFFMGEGFFDVAHDAAHPFLIQSDKMQIQVLGTKFNVKALSKQAIFQVYVVSGSVALRSMPEAGKITPEAIVLTSRQKALFEVATNQLTTLETSTEAKREIYEPISVTFNETQVGEVVRQLERQFNIHIQLSDKGISKCLLTADFNHQSLPVILEILCASLDLTYTFSGDTLILKGAGCE